MNRIPLHIGIIMDGNGRWAKLRGLHRNEGHKAAEKAIHEVVEVCGEIGVGFLTLFAFSSENWSRPKPEVEFILNRLLGNFIKRNIDELDRNNVRLRASGRIEFLPNRALSILRKAMERTSGNTGLQLILALNYGGRNEILDSVRSLAKLVLLGDLDPETITLENMSSGLYLPDVPDPDLIIRTSGEQRISNFLLWQSAYSELYFTDVLWPDFRRENLERAIESFNARDRRFGGLTSENTSKKPS